MSVILNETAVFNETLIFNDTLPLNESDYEGIEGNYTALSLQEVIDHIRGMYIEEFYGEHYHAILVSALIMCILGYITNTFNIIVLSKTPMSNSMNIFLMALSISDILQMTTQISHAIHYLSGFKMFPFYNWIVFIIVNTFFENCLICVSNSLAAMIGIWRCIAITWPLQSLVLCNPYRAKIAMFAICVVSILLSVPIFALFTYQVVEIDAGVLVYLEEHSELALRNDKQFIKVYAGFQQIKLIVPMVVMLVTTIWMGVSLYRIRKVKTSVLYQQMSSEVNHRITIMLTILLLLYLLSNIPDTVQYLAYISIEDEEMHQEIEQKINLIRIFSMANNSASFFIYYALGEDFRRRFNKIFCRCAAIRKRSVPEDLSENSTILNKRSDVVPMRTFQLSELKKAVEKKGDAAER